jgi:DNA-directed RNA polymerase subunit K/omega
MGDNDMFIEGDGAVLVDADMGDEYDAEDFPGTIEGGMSLYGDIPSFGELNPVGNAMGNGDAEDMADGQFDMRVPTAIDESFPQMLASGFGNGFPSNGSEDLASAYSKGDDYAGPGVRSTPVAPDGMATLASKCSAFTKMCPSFIRVVASAAIPKPTRADAKIQYITGEQRRTSRIMTRFERARIIGTRAKEIENNADNIHQKIVDKVMAEGVDNSLNIADIELEDTSVPFPLTILRPIGLNTFEIWPVRDLILPSEILCMSYSTTATDLMLGSSNLGRACPYNPANVVARSFKRYAIATSNI